MVEINGGDVNPLVIILSPNSKKTVGYDYEYLCKVILFVRIANLFLIPAISFYWIDKVIKDLASVGNVLLGVQGTPSFSCLLVTLLEIQLFLLIGDSYPDTNSHLSDYRRCYASNLKGLYCQILGGAVMTSIFIGSMHYVFS